MTKVNLSPEEIDLYARLLPIYRENINKTEYKDLGPLFTKYFLLVDCSAGEAMQKAMRELGIISLEDISSMQDGVLEYEEIMSLQTLMKRETL